MCAQMFEFEMWQIARGAVNAWTRTLDARMHVLNLVLVLQLYIIADLLLRTKFSSIDSSSTAVQP